TEDLHFLEMSSLNGTQKVRVLLAQALFGNPDILLLDEPTNDLDLITLRKLEEFLAEQYTGCLVVVTHDRYFMDRLVDHLFVFEGEGQIRDYPGSYSQYRKAVEQEEKVAAEATPKEEKTPKTARKDPQGGGNQKRKLSYKEKREFEQIEGEIDQMETRKAELEELIGSGETDYEKLTAWSEELETLKADLDVKSDRWLELMEIIEG
ncbi:MAG: ATP-binding cassette domain-containing protein, partial [Bacteroidota bacterium]